MARRAQARPQQRCPWPLKTPAGEGTKGGGCSEKAFTSGEGLGQLLHRDSLPRVSATAPRCSSPPALALRWPGQVCSQPWSCRVEGGGVCSQPRDKNHPRNKNRPWRKAPSQHKGLPICQIFKQSLNFPAGTYLEADLQSPPGFCSAWPGSIRLQPREPRSAAATDPHTPIILLSKH